MKTYEHQLAHSYEHSKSIFRYSSASFVQSLTTALLLDSASATMASIMAARKHEPGEILKVSSRKCCCVLESTYSSPTVPLQNEEIMADRSRVLCTGLRPLALSVRFVSVSWFMS